MKKMYNWLKKDDRFWWILIITVILAIIIGTMFFWDWMWKHIFVFILLWIILSGWGTIPTRYDIRNKK